MSSPFSRGYKECNDRVMKSAKYTRSCFNCSYYYQASGDKEECCQNNSVLEFDMTVTDTNCYCTYWAQTKKKDDTLFKRNGRSILD